MKAESDAKDKHHSRDMSMLNPHSRSRTRAIQDESCSQEGISRALFRISFSMPKEQLCTIQLGRNASVQLVSSAIRMADW